jgi:hypothetical protein
VYFYKLHVSGPRTIYSHQLGEWLVYVQCVSPVEYDSTKVCHSGFYDYYCYEWDKNGISKNDFDSGAVFTLTSNKLLSSNRRHPCDTLFINMVKKDSLITTFKMRPECPNGKFLYERHYCKRRKWYQSKS